MHNPNPYHDNVYTVEEGHMVKCAKAECYNRFLLTKKNAFQRFCPGHHGEQKPPGRRGKATKL